MKLLPLLRNFTRSKFLFVAFVASAAASGQGIIQNTLQTGQNLFSPAPVSIMATGAGGAFLAFKNESYSGYTGFLPNSPFNAMDRVDNFLFGAALPASAATLWIAGKLTDSKETENSGEELCRGLLFSYSMVQTLKFTTSRTRPDGSNARSFPSGHAAGAACTAVIAWNRCGAGAGIPLSAMALYTCISRINLGKHFPSDVIMGAAIGTACGIAAAAVDHEEGETDFSFSLCVDTEGRIVPSLW